MIWYDLILMSPMSMSNFDALVSLVAHSFHLLSLAAKDSVSSSGLPSIFLCGTVPVPQLLTATQHKLDWLMKRPSNKRKLSCFGSGHFGIVFAAFPGRCKMPQAACYGCVCATRGKDTVENDWLAGTVDSVDSVDHLAVENFRNPIN